MSKKKNKRGMVVRKLAKKPHAPAALILAGQSQINECDTTVRGKFAPGERRAFQIECYGVAGSGTPDNINYRVEVVNGKAEI